MAKMTSCNRLMLLIAALSTTRAFRPDPVAELQIRNNLSLYALAIDTKNFGLLADAFTQDVTAYLPLPPPNDVLHGLDSFQQALQNALGTIITQHTLSTTVVDFTSSNNANSTIYLVANYLGVGNNTGTTLQFYGKYLDQWRPANDTWKSFNRTLVFLVCSSSCYGNFGVERVSICHTFVLQADPIGNQALSQP